MPSSPEKISPPRSGRWGLIALVIGCAAAGAGLAWTWHWHGRIARLQAARPHRPDLSHWPAPLREAIARAEAAAANSSSAADGLAQLGRLYHANGFRAEAEACWQALRREQPKDGHWDYYLADLRRAESDYPAMMALLEETVRRAPGYAPAWLHLAELRFKTGQAEAARAAYQQRLALVPGDRYARLGLARLALQAGQRDEARRLLEQLVKDAKDFSTGHNLYAEMLEADGDKVGAGQQRWLGRETARYREADDPWLEELNASCYDYDRLCVLGTVEYQTQHGDGGVAILQRAIALDPARPTAYEQLGSFFLLLNRTAEAREVLEREMQQARNPPPSPMAYVNLSHAYRTLKQPAEAVRIARVGLERTGGDPILYDALGVAEGDAGDLAESVAAFREALRRTPNDSNANFNFALALLRLGRKDEAVDALHRALVRQPTLPSALATLARLSMEEEDWTKAAEYLAPLYAAHPEMPEARQLKTAWELHAGHEAEARNDDAAAEQHYRAGIDADHAHAELRVALGVLLLTHARFGDAVEPLEAYHRLQPKNPQACLFLGQAYAASGKVAEARKVLQEGVTLGEQAGGAGKVTAEHCREILQQLN